LPSKSINQDNSRSSSNPELHVFQGAKKKTHILISLGINREKTSPSLTKALEYNNQ
jgi:hypothetical protein